MSESTSLQDLAMIGPHIQDDPQRVDDHLRAPGALHYQQTVTAERGKLITEIVRLLDTTPDEWVRVRADPGRAKPIVEEALRWASPSQTAFRRATRDTALFDPDRSGLGQHLAFWLGMHSGIGNPLARMEGVVASQVLADHVESLSVLTPESLQYNVSFMGLPQLPVAARRRTPGQY